MKQNSTKLIIHKPYQRILAFCIFIVVSSFISGYTSPDNVIKRWLAFVSGYMNEIPFDAISIFLNNILIATFLVLGGFFFGIIPITIGWLNFFSLGVLTAHFSRRIGWIPYLLSLIPHGILEIPAIMISIYAGIKIFFIIRDKSICQKRNLIIYEIKKTFKIIVPLFLLASIIETYITPLITLLYFTLK